jgi:hypothetical protein
MLLVGIILAVVNQLADYAITTSKPLKAINQVFARLTTTCIEIGDFLIVTKRALA